MQFFPSSPCGPRGSSDLYPSASVRSEPTVIFCGGSGMHWLFSELVTDHIASLAHTMCSSPALARSPEVSGGLHAAVGPGPSSGPCVSPVPFDRTESLYAALEAAALAGAGEHTLDSPATRPLLIIVPVTDDGGSSRAIMDVLGGPAVGDLRNVLLLLAKVTATAVGVPLRRSSRASSAHSTPTKTINFATSDEAVEFVIRQHTRTTSFSGSGVLSSDEEVDVTSLGGEAAARYFSAPELCHSERFLHAVLKFRLDAESEEVARLQRDSIRSAFTNASSDSLLFRVGRAFAFFATFVDDSFGWKAASIGNMFLAGRMLQILHEEDSTTEINPAAPAHVAAALALEEAALEMARMLGVPPHITVVPASSWIPAPENAGPTIGDLLALSKENRSAFVLPRYELRLSTLTGWTVHGQTRISYGTDGTVVKTPSPQHGTAVINKEDAAPGLVMPDWADHDDPATLTCKVLQREWGGVSPGPLSSSSSAAAGSPADSSGPGVQQQQQQRPQDDDDSRSRLGRSGGQSSSRSRAAALRNHESQRFRRTLVFGSGSFLTSTLASAATVSAIWPPNVRFDAVVLLNASVDRETAGFFHEPAVRTANTRSQHEECACDQRVGKVPVVRLLAVLRRVVPAVARVKAVLCAYGSVFEPCCQRLLSKEPRVVQSACAACCEALVAAGVDEQTQFVLCRAAATVVAPRNHSIAATAATSGLDDDSVPSGFFDATDTVRRLSAQW